MGASEQRETARTIAAYLLGRAERSPHHVRSGPFVLHLDPSSDHPFRNYAIPDLDARPSPGEVSRLADAFRRRGRMPRLEYLPAAAPRVREQLLSSGFSVDETLPVLAVTPSQLGPAQLPGDVRTVFPTQPGELADLARVQHEAYAEAGEPGPEDTERLRRSLEEGAIPVLAYDTATGEPAGGGICTPIVDGLTELTGVAVREAFRRRGIGALVTGLLASEAVRRGARLVWLTPASDEPERIYTRAGFSRVGEILFVSQPGNAASFDPNGVDSTEGR